VFEDEFASAFTEGLAPTWAPRGQTPQVWRIGYFRRVLSTVVGLTVSGRILKRHYRGAIRGEQMVQALQHFRRHLQGPLIVIWDRARAHLSGKVKAYLAAHPEIELEWLPAYAPELNPEEYCHGHVKRQLGNMTPSDTAALRRLLNGGFARLRRRPAILLGCIHHAGLPLKQLW
jgi:transposase